MQNIFNSSAAPPIFQGQTIKIKTNARTKCPAQAGDDLPVDPLERVVKLRGWTWDALSKAGADVQSICMTLPMIDGWRQLVGRRKRLLSGRAWADGKKAMTFSGGKNGALAAQLDAPGSVLVLEGEADLLGALSAGWTGPVLATPGANPGQMSLRAVVALSAGRPCVLAPHGDSAGRDWLATVGERLARYGCPLRVIACGGGRDLDDARKVEPLERLVEAAYSWWPDDLEEEEREPDPVPQPAGTPRIAKHPDQLPPEACHGWGEGEGETTRIITEGRVWVAALCLAESEEEARSLMAGWGAIGVGAAKADERARRIADLTSPSGWVFRGKKERGSSPAITPVQKKLFGLSREAIDLGILHRLSEDGHRPQLIHNVRRAAQALIDFLAEGPRDVSQKLSASLFEVRRRTAVTLRDILIELRVVKSLAIGVGADGSEQYWRWSGISDENAPRQLELCRGGLEELAELGRLEPREVSFRCRYLDPIQPSTAPHRRATRALMAQAQQADKENEDSGEQGSPSGDLSINVCNHGYLEVSSDSERDEPVPDHSEDQDREGDEDERRDEDDPWEPILAQLQGLGASAVFLEGGHDEQ